MSSVDRRTALDIIRTTLAADSACKPSDWLSNEVIVVEAREVEGRRRWPMRANPFSMATFGNGVVITCSADRMAWAEENLAHHKRDELFSISTLARIANFVAPDRQRVAGPYPHYFCVSDTFRAVEAPTGFTVEIFGREQMAEVYRFEGFSHALGYRLESPDMLAAVAWQEGQVVGIAGVSADSAQMWQVGIDVVPEYQGMGLGKALASRATEATLEHGKTPYYTHHISNIRSGNTARGVGYQPVWVDVYVRDL